MLYKIINLFIRFCNKIFTILQQACLIIVDFHFVSALRQTVFSRLIFYLFATNVPGNLDVWGNRCPSTICSSRKSTALRAIASTG